MARLFSRQVADPILKRIWELFIAPMAAAAPDQDNTKEFLELLFCVDTRDIVSYKVVKDFTMPGLKVEAPGVRIQGIGYRLVTQDKIITVRTDSTNKNAVDVEYFAGRGSAHQLYQLSNSEWEKIKLNLEPLQFLDRHFKDKEL